MNFNSFPKKVKIVEVGPRDGLQNEKVKIGPQDKIEFIKSLAKTGFESVEVTSFVRASKIPQMADSSDVYKGVSHLNIDLPCLVPNMKGLEIALNSGVKSIAVFTATSNEFNKKNINASIDESLDKIKNVLKEAKNNNLRIRGYISTVFGCPYEGRTSIDNLFKILNFFNDFDIDEYSLGDTIGVAVPKQVDDILKSLRSKYDMTKIALHFHNTRGMALSNVLIGLNNGVRIFDSSAAGLGGCPYAKGATGNLATEDLVYLLNSLGIETGIDLEALPNASSKMLNLLNRPSDSKIHRILKDK